MELDKFRDVDLVISHANDSFFFKPFVSQNDNNGRTLTVQVTNDGVAGEIPGLSLNLRWTNQASGLTDLSAFELIDKDFSVFQITYPKNMLNPGKVVASIQIIQNGQVAHSKQFEITVQQLAGEAKGIIQKAEYGALVEVLADSNKFRTDIDALENFKANKTDVAKVEDMISQMPSATPKETFISLAALQTKYPNGNSSAMVVLEANGETGYIYLWNGSSWKKGALYQAQGLADGSVKSVKLAESAVIADKILKGQITDEKFVQPLMVKKRGKNLFDKSKAAKGFYYNGETGALTLNSNYAAALIDIREFEIGTSIMRNGFRTFAVFDRDMNRIGGSAGGTYQYLKEVGAAYLGLTIDIEAIDTFQVELGTSVSSYEPFEDYLNPNDILDKSLPVKKIDAPVIIGKPGKNLFNKQKEKIGYYYSGVTGNLTPNDAFAAYLLDVREYVEGTELYQNINRTFAFYDENMSFISGSSGGENIITLPENCAFVGLSVEKSALDIFQVELGAEGTAYEPFREVVTEELLSTSLIDKINKASRADELKVLMPSTVFLTIGEEWSIYWRNVIKGWKIFQSGDYSVRLQERLSTGNYQTIGEDIGYKWFWTPETAGTKQVEVRITKNDTQEVIDSVRFDLEIVEAMIPAVKSKTGLTYGDSFTDQYGVSRFIHDFVSSDAKKTFNMIGTNDSGKAGVMDNAWSGRDYSWLYNSPTGPLRNDRPLSDAIWDSGWGKDELNGWREDDNYHSLTPEQRTHGFTRNEMYNPVTKKMDFSYFMAERMNNQHIDSVVSLYGLNNSTWKVPTQLISELPTYKIIIRTLIDQIKAYDQNIKILIGTVTPQSEDDAFMRSYGTNFLTDQRAKTAVDIWNEFLIDEFDTAEMQSKNVFVMPIHANFDTRYGLLTKEIHPVKFDQSITEIIKRDVHPTDIGSKYIADTVRNFINGVIY